MEIPFLFSLSKVWAVPIFIISVIVLIPVLVYMFNIDNRGYSFNDMWLFFIVYAFIVVLFGVISMTFAFAHGIYKEQVAVNVTKPCTTYALFALETGEIFKTEDKDLLVAVREKQSFTLYTRRTYNIFLQQIDTRKIICPSRSIMSADLFVDFDARVRQLN